MSFRAKREILWEQAIEKIGFLPTVEMTNTSFPTFYELVNLDEFVKSLFGRHPGGRRVPEHPELTLI
jgi:hypothetical protein